MSYEKTPINTVNRKANKANYEVDVVHRIVNAASVLHVSFVPDVYDPLPVILPMIGFVGAYPGGAQDTQSKSDDEKEAAAAAAAAEPCVWLHGYTSSRFFKQATKESGPEANDDEDPTETDAGLPVCLAATLVDGLVLSLTPNSHSLNFQSAILHGRAHLVRDERERLWAMQAITDHVLPGRWAQTRTPPNGAERSSTKILKVRIASASAKIRAAEPADERADLGREDVLQSVWTGVVPMHTVYGEPVQSSYNRVKEVPANIGEFIKRRNEEGEAYARSVATKAPPK
ncbi:hypothetical protein OC842_003529 [Tilletia horrida]|uniref:Flavin-nucleotide-binding protein n=1 Tax=Tilletia horrida TaxID=155126 RepID=A0AAN6JKC9_9BASI|nr:hypothetical protein OC842_003529 [Tilletia horrida]